MAVATETEAAVHHLRRAEDIRLQPFYTKHSEKFARCSLIDRTAGSVHMGFGLCALGAGGRIDTHVHSFEESFYILEGEPVLVLDRRCYPLSPGTCGVIPVGVPHAWIGPPSRDARWLDMMAPQPRAAGLPEDTFFIGPPEAERGGETDIRDPRARHFFRMTDSDIDVDSLKIGARIDAPTVSASMATALLVYSGISVKMLVDQRLDAQLHTMFMVDYQPGGAAHLHDHPLEEAYYILDGEVEAVADDKTYTLKPGDVFWTGVGCIHAFYNRSNRRVRWLETQAPQPPSRHSYRFNRDWEYLQQKLAAGK
jgi:quercetin dioxygenase-like cupin family protein